MKYLLILLALSGCAANQPAHWVADQNMKPAKASYRFPGGI